MKLGWILLLGFGLTAGWWGLRKLPQLSKPAGQGAIDKAKADILKFGWHVVAVRGQGGPGFLFTIGLWKSYKHPEILLFAPSEDPSGALKPFTALVKRVAAGETLKSGEVLGKAFKDHDGAVRDVLPQWFPSFLGTAGGVYGNWDFPVVQLYWPDKAGRFPWQSGFDPRLFSFQPVLYQDNLILAGVGSDEIQQIVENQGPRILEASIADLGVRLGDGAKGDLIEDWRWRVGPKAELTQLTVFGDFFIKTPDGHIHWLDTGSDVYEDIATDEASWRRAICDHPAVFFHASALLHARSLKYLPKEGEVYDWIQSPLLGGKETVDNLQLVPAPVGISSSGRMAQSVREGKKPAPEAGPEDKTVYVVVINDEKQYSMWPMEQPIPAGWKSTGKTGTKQECLDFIKTVWTDLRPESLRQKRREEEPHRP
jgi:uncharacterized protein YbdZ (MbtH family)